MGGRATRVAIVLSCAALIVACASSSSSPASTPAADGGGLESGTGTDAEADAEAPFGVELLAAFDLPRTAETQALSGAWFDVATKTLFAVPDRAAQLVPLTASDDLRAWTVGTPIALTGRVETTWDGEGVTRVGDTFFVVTNETTPTIERFDATGKRLGAVEIAPRFAKQAPGNKGIESLTSSPSGKYLFFANEAALTTDGATATKAAGTLVRIARRDLAAGTVEERAYRTEPLGRGTGGDMGVSELHALSDDRLLVLERGYQSGFGNTVRIFEIGYAGDDVAGRDALDDRTPALAKRLLVDIGTLPSAGVTHPSTQPNPILDNYEALALGPKLPDGRQVVFVVSDDNAQKSQVARILTLAIGAR